MKPVSPVMPGYSEPYEFLLAEDQPEYEPIPTVLAEGPEKRMVSRWEFTEEERWLIALGGSLIFQQLTFGNPFHPVSFKIVSKQVAKKTKTEDSCLCNGIGCARCCGPS